MTIKWIKRSLLLMLMVYSGVSLARDFQIAVIPKGTRHVFWQTVHAGAMQAARDLDVTVQWRGPSEDDDHRAQIRFVERAIRSGVDGIVLAPNHRLLLVDAVRKATEQGIKVVIIDSDLNGNYHLSFVGTDNYHGGAMAARRLARVLGGKGNVMLLRYFKGNSSTDLREQGFVDTLKKEAPAITITADDYVGASLGEAYHNSARLLAQHPEIDGIFAPNESSTSGVLLALTKAFPERLGKIKVVGFDSNQELLKSLEENRIQGLIVQQPYQIGYLGVKTMVEALQGQEIPHRIVTDILLVTPENLDELRDKIPNKSERVQK